MRHHGTIAKKLTVEGGVGDVGDVGGWWDGKGRCPNHPTTGGWQGARRKGKRGGRPVHLQQDRAGTPCRSGGAYTRG